MFVTWPSSLIQIYHPEGELPVARIAGEFGLPYSLSTAGSSSIEEAAEHNALGAAKGVKQGSGAEYKEGLRFYQLYATHDQELNESLLTRAHKSGYDACIMTLDTWQLAWRCVLCSICRGSCADASPLDFTSCRHLDISLSNYGFYKGETFPSFSPLTMRHQANLIDETLFAFHRYWY